MTKEQLAEKLNGREYGSEISAEEEKEASEAGLIVIFGYSDDNAEIRGYIHDEVGCYEGGIIKLHNQGVMADHKEPCDCAFCGYKDAAKKCVVVEALWCEEGGDGCSWTYKPDLPYATFEIFEDGQKYCRGIVISASDLPSL